MLSAAMNEPDWLKIARGASVKIADADIPPPREAESAMWVADVIRAAIGQGVKNPETGQELQEPGDTIGELSMYGQAIDTGKMVPRAGSIVIITKPQMWIPASQTSKAAKLPNTAKSHVGFLVRSTTGNIYILGEGVVRVFPRVAAGAWRWPS